MQEDTNNNVDNTVSEQSGDDAAQEVKAPERKDEIIGEVVKTSGERAIVELFEKNSKKKSNEVVDVSNPIKAPKGYIVRIEWRKTSKTRDNFMLFAPPVLSAIAGVVFSYGMFDYFNRRKPVPFEDVMMICVGVWLFLGLFYSIRHYRQNYGRGNQLTIIGILRKA